MTPEQKLTNARALLILANASDAGAERAMNNILDRRRDWRGQLAGPAPETDNAREDLALRTWEGLRTTSPMVAAQYLLAHQRDIVAARKRLYGVTP